MDGGGRWWREGYHMGLCVPVTVGTLARMSSPFAFVSPLDLASGLPWVICSSLRLSVPEHGLDGRPIRAPSHFRLLWLGLLRERYSSVL
jgi:hypothetical protein